MRPVRALRADRPVTIGAAVAGGVLLAIALGLAWVAFTPDPGPTDTPSDANTAVHAAMIDAGIPDAAVDVTPDRALVRYDVPDGMPVNRSIFVAAIETATTVPDTETVVLQVYDDGRPLVQVTVEAGTARAFVDREIDAAAFWESLEVRSAA